MNTKRLIPRFVQVFIVWLLIILRPWLLLLIPPLKHLRFLMPMAFIQSMFLINIPGFPLAHAFGPPHFRIEEFGTLPQDATAYGLILLFWVLVAVGLTAITESVIRAFRRPKGRHENVCFQCSECGKNISARHRDIGLVIHCPECGGRTMVPEAMG